MNLYHLLFWLSFFSIEIFGTGGEIYISIKSGTSTTLTYNVHIDRIGYAWDLDESTGDIILDEQDYPLEFLGLSTISSNTIKFDSPDSKNSSNNYVGWGLIRFTFSWEIDYVPYSTSIILDLRDANWAEHGAYVGTHDTHLYIDQQTSIVYYTIPYHSYAQVPQSPAKIWEMWHAEPDYHPVQAPFDFPVTLNNKIENEEFYFGYLKHNAKTVNSGEYSLFNEGSTNTVSHGTLEEQYNSDRNYSFIWDYSSQYVTFFIQ